MNSQMPSDGRVTGGGHLARRSLLVKRIHELGLNLRLLIGEDKSQDAHFITKPLSRLFGVHAEIVWAATVSELKSALRNGTFSIIILDDRMDAGVTADQTLPMIRSAGHAGPVLVVSAMLTNARRAELKRLGVDAVLAKDELDSVELGYRVLQLLGHEIA